MTTALSDLTDDLIAEILLHVSPVRWWWENPYAVALVCRSRHRILSDSDFRRRYSALHGAPIAAYEPLID
jgi:hypothetical protein